jgi:ribose 5-phosphate isomerase B
MKLYIGSDHAGYKVKQQIQDFLVSLGHDVVDTGTDSEVNCDFPDYAKAVAENVASSDACGILLCSTGVGMCIAANRFKRVRAAVCYDVETVKGARHHDDVNVLCLGSKVSSFDTIKKLITTFLSEPFEHVERRVRRMNKLDSF